MPRRRKVEGKPEPGRALSSLLIEAQNQRRARRYRKSCYTCATDGAAKIVADSMRTVLADPHGHRGVTLTDIFAVVRQETGSALRDNTLMSHVRGHEADLYAKWNEARRG